MIFLKLKAFSPIILIPSGRTISVSFPLYFVSLPVALVIMNFSFDLPGSDELLSELDESRFDFDESGFVVVSFVLASILVSRSSIFFLFFFAFASLILLSLSVLVFCTEAFDSPALDEDELHDFVVDLVDVASGDLFSIVFVNNDDRKSLYRTILTGFPLFFNSMAACSFLSTISDSITR